MFKAVMLGAAAAIRVGRTQVTDEVITAGGTLEPPVLRETGQVRQGHIACFLSHVSGILPVLAVDK